MKVNNPVLIAVLTANIVMISKVNSTVIFVKMITVNLKMVFIVNMIKVMINVTVVVRLVSGKIKKFAKSVNSIII